MGMAAPPHLHPSGFGCAQGRDLLRLAPALIGGQEEPGNLTRQRGLVEAYSRLEDGGVDNGRAARQNPPRRTQPGLSPPQPRPPIIRVVHVLCTGCARGRSGSSGHLPPRGPEEGQGGPGTQGRAGWGRAGDPGWAGWGRARDPEE